MKAVHIVSWILLVIGGLNWGLVGALDFNLVDKIFGSWPSVVTIVYILVGISAIIAIFTHKKDCKCCDTASTPSM
jgi:uncharacterized membrane protein YuzA (DUF378 family)